MKSERKPRDWNEAVRSVSTRFNGAYSKLGIKSSTLAKTLNFIGDLTSGLGAVREVIPFPFAIFGAIEGREYRCEVSKLEEMKSAEISERNNNSINATRKEMTTSGNWFFGLSLASSFFANYLYNLPANSANFLEAYQKSGDDLTLIALGLYLNGLSRYVAVGGNTSLVPCEQKQRNKRIELLPNLVRE